MQFPGGLLQLHKYAGALSIAICRLARLRSLSK
jgi:hypothetical protein